MIECQQDFVHYRWCNATITDDNDRLAMVGQGFEMTFLWIGEREHGKTEYDERFGQCNRR